MKLEKARMLLNYGHNAVILCWDLLDLNCSYFCSTKIVMFYASFFKGIHNTKMVQCINTKIAS